MKAGKGGILKKKGPLASEQLEVESKRMEERLIELREHMKLEKERRQSEVRFKDGSRWRGAVTTKPMHGYADVVLKTKPRPAPQPRPSSKGFIPTSDLLAYDPPPKDTEQKMAENLKRANTLPPAPAVEPIRQFLESCGLEKHYDTFISNGIDDMEVVLELTEEHLTNLNLPMGHRIKLLKRIRDLKANQGEELEALPPPQHSISDSGTGTETGGALLRGEYNEAESYALFKDALDQFRRGGTTTHHLSSPKDSAPDNKENRSDSKRVRFVDESEAAVSKSSDPADSKPPAKVWMTDGATDWQPDAAFATSEEGTEAVSTTGNPAERTISDTKVSCWECFKIFSEGITFLDKPFCSEKCKSLFLASLYIECECGKTFIKTAGVFEGGKWYCSEDCVPPVRSPSPDEQETPQDQGEYSDDPYDVGEFTAIDPTTGDPISLS